ncbi:MAG TPA: hypothetical protein VF823_12110 [Anaerolineales bacterium]
MNIGMLWFDNDPKAELNTKIERAAAYYRNKYGRTPTLCFVHPSMLPKVDGENSKPEAKTVKSGDMEVRPTRSVLPNHFWIGVNSSYPGAAD